MQTTISDVSPIPMFLLDLPYEQWPAPGDASYRREQVAKWIFQDRVTSFDAMSNLPMEWRKEMSQKYSLTALEAVRVQGSGDTTRKFLWKLRGGDYVESVLIPASPALYGEKSDRHTLCISTQVGCAYGCKFCASGLEGWKRNLTAGEIVAQIMEAERQSGKKINNLVFMGMGEPMANYDRLMEAIEIINSPKGLNIGARHITISTSGLVPQIRKLADQPKQLRLAISLHGASNEVRGKIMPVNKKYPVEELMDACVYFVEKKQKMITFEYILIEGVNDSPDEARLLSRHARRIFAKVNLIPYNKVEGLKWNRPAEWVVDKFEGILKVNGVKTTVRREKGHDIDAACGQLRLKQLNAGDGEESSIPIKA